MSTFSVRATGPLRGRVRPPGDKSISHRALMLAALADGTSEVTGRSDGLDVRHTAGAITALGAVIDGDRITGSRLREPAGVVDVGNSGTAIRLLAGLVASQPWTTTLRGDASVDRRPMDRIASPLRLMGAAVEDAYPPLVVHGGALRGIDYRSPVASAQVKSCVLLAGLGAEGDTIVREDAPTRMHTEEMLAAAGADIETGDGWARVRRSTLQPFSLDVPCDPSQAAFWVVAASIISGSEVMVERVYVGPGRAGFLDVLRRMGADIDLISLDATTADIVVRGTKLRATTVEAEEVPGLIDEVPILAVAASLAEGTTRFEGVHELRVKESDRLATTTALIQALGASASHDEDSLEVVGAGRLSGGVVNSHGDHRIAMAAAVAGLAGDGVRVQGWDAVATSYPRFEADLRSCAS
ncbi:MAG TPA: 3-phosphoshikimate 1-carboxyvinyltransferase [Acidimicrobiales bacterium]|nr:3-phosphoshikimate 1-carboxyvinyltransferase [Acidimicrobiales bacterium]